jgi:hypothetical protein
MWPRAVVVSILAIQLLMLPALAADLLPEAIPLPVEGDVFHVLQSVTVDGGENGNDEARGISVAADGTVYVTGYVTVAGQGRNIWLGKYSRELVYQDSVTVNGPADGDDEGYTIAFDQSGHLYLVGYMTEAGEDHNIWLGKFDSDLVLLDEITVNGTDNDADDGYGILFDGVSGNLYVAGTVRAPGQGANIWLAIYDTDLDLVDDITMNGPVNDTDKARFMAFDDTRHLFVSGSMTVDLSRDYDIWIGKFKDDLTFVDDVTVAGPTTDEDKGYGIVFDGSDTLFVTGTMIETNESYNVWMAKLDTDLTVIDELTINGPEDGEDVAYMMTKGPSGRLYHTGTFTEAVGGSNIWLARFDPALNLEAWVTVDGPASGFDTGVGVAMGDNYDLYVSAIVSDPLEGLNIWIGHYDVSTAFADGFETGDTSSWSSATP